MAIPFDAPDIMCALPEEAVRRVRPQFTSWSELIESHDPLTGNFKKHVMDALNWKRNDDRGFISAVLDQVVEQDEVPSVFRRARSQILAWGEDLSTDVELGLSPPSV